MFKTIVVGSDGQRGRSAAAGYNAMGVLHSSRCVVAVAPDDLPPCGELATIGVGLDTTPEAHAGRALSLGLARR